MTNNERSVKEIHQVMEQWAAALYDKNLEAMHKDYSEEGYRLFDVQETVEDIEGLNNLWERCFPFFDKPKIEYKDMVVQATDDMAVVHFRNRISGTLEPMPEEMQNTWLRGTVCYRKMDGSWKCIHEHISFPVDCEKMTIAQSA